MTTPEELQGMIETAKTEHLAALQAVDAAREQIAKLRRAHLAANKRAKALAAEIAAQRAELQDVAIDHFAVTDAAFKPKGRGLADGESEARMLSDLIGELFWRARMAEIDLAECEGAALVAEAAVLRGQAEASKAQAVAAVEGIAGSIGGGMVEFHGAGFQLLEEQADSVLLAGSRRLEHCTERRQKLLAERDTAIRQQMSRTLACS